MGQHRAGSRLATTRMGDHMDTGAALGISGAEVDQALAYNENLSATIVNDTIIMDQQGQHWSLGIVDLK